MLYIPAGWAFAEITSELSIGFKTPMFTDMPCAHEFFAKAKSSNSDNPGAREQQRIADAYLQAMSHHTKPKAEVAEGGLIAGRQYRSSHFLLCPECATLGQHL